MKATSCPFCGLATDVPHNTQEGCIQALHDEIARMRRILDRVHPADAPRPAPAENEDEAENEPA